MVSFRAPAFSNLLTVNWEKRRYAQIHLQICSTDQAIVFIFYTFIENLRHSSYAKLDMLLFC